MKVTVLYFGIVRERLGLRDEAVELSDGATVADLLENLERRHDLAGMRSGVLRVAVNRDYVDSTGVLSDNDEVAIIPPVSGGSHVRHNRRAHLS